MATIPPPDKYKRRHPPPVGWLEDGDVARALAYLEELLGKDPSDPETHLVLAMAHARAGSVGLALASARAALEHGLPPGRLLAPPAELLAPLAETRTVRALLDDPAARLVHGPMLGDVRPDGARIWVRTPTPEEVAVVVRDGRGVSVASEVVRTDADVDAAGVARVGGLAPASAYTYAVVPGGGEPGEGSTWHSLRTAPPDGAAGRTRIAFGGCAGWVPWNERVWDSIHADEPDLFLMLGDNIYIDAPESPMRQRYGYARRRSRPEWRRLTADVPVYAVWDDHDFGVNDCHGGPDPGAPPWKRDVWRRFRGEWPNPAFGAPPEWPGTWFDFTRGDLHVLMLDCRTYREDPRGEAPSMLGPVQKAWLKERLGSVDATFRLLCSSVPWNLHAKGDSLDTWRGHREERDELFTFLADEGIGGVVLLSSDRHRNDAWRIERPGAYPLTEFNSGRMTNQHTHPTMKRALFSYNATCAFGRVDVDTTRADPSIAYEVVTIDREVVHRLELRRSELGAA